MGDNRDDFMTAQQPAALDVQIESDYEMACRWFGPMPFGEFAAGYRAMADWYARWRVSPDDAHAAVA
jgi:hypothetical protein